MALNLRSWISGTVGLIVSALIGVLTFVYFAVMVATRSHTEDELSATAAVTDSVMVYRNSFGVPHVVGRTDLDAVTGQGFVHAQDRLWQMDVWRRFGQGRLAEVLGPSAVKADVFMRSLQIPAIAERQYAELPATTRDLLKAYSEGVNAFLTTHQEAMSFEFDALGYHPEPWTPIDCLIVGRVVAFELSLAFWNDITYAQILRQRGYDAMREYVPQAPGPPYVLDSSGAAPPSVPSVRYGDTTARTAPAVDRVSESLSSVRELLGLRGSAVGSNCWAVGRSDTGGAILANDPHLSVSMPPKWYQIHLTGDRLNSVGLGIPGVPLVLTGRNDQIAWGVTNVMVDDVDYIVERVDQTNNNYYFEADGSRKKFRFRLDTIRIAKQPDTLIYLRFTERGCVISDGHPYSDPSWLFKMPRTASTRYLDQNCLTYRWTAQIPSDEVGALYRVNRATTFEDVEQALGTWHAPAFNFHVAQRNGRVGTVAAGIIPNRVNTDPLIPAPVSSSARWDGFIHLRALGSVVKRPPARVASANNRTISGQAPFISTYFQPSSRIKRIGELAAVYTEMSVRDAQVMQMDQISPYASALVRKLLPYLEKGYKQFNPTQRAALSALQKWDGAMTPIDEAASIYAVMLQRLFWNTFEDELGSQLYYDWVFVTSNPYNRLEDLLNEPRHPLFDDVRTKNERENLAWIAVRSFLEAVEQLETTFENNAVSTWKFGRLRSITFPHMMGSHPLLKPVMNIGPYEIGGSTTTLFNTEWSVYRPFESVIYSSGRLISDLSDSVQYTVLPGGISGQPLDPHYSDQVQLWLKGGYIRVPTSRTPDVTFRRSVVLTP